MPGPDLFDRLRREPDVEAPDLVAVDATDRLLLDEAADSLTAAGYGEITTEIAPLGDFYYAEDYHQQYLYKVPGGYCPIHSTGVSCPVGLSGV